MTEKQDVENAFAAMNHVHDNYPQPHSLDLWFDEGTFRDEQHRQCYLVRCQKFNGLNPATKNQTFIPMGSSLRTWINHIQAMVDTLGE